MENARVIIDVDGIETSLATGGNPAGRTLLFLHGATPGVTPYSGGSFIWEPVLGKFAADYAIITIDLLGSGNTGYPERVAVVDDFGAHIQNAIAQITDAPYHVIGHGFGGVIAMWLALNDEKKASTTTIVASGDMAPLIDSLDDLTFLNLPGAPWSREAQRWAYERVSYAGAHIDDDLLTASIAAAATGGAVKAQKAMGQEMAPARVAASVGKLKQQLWARCKQGQIPTALQYIWADNDPSAPRERGYKLFEFAGSGMTHSQFHLVNRCGSFIFREQPELFHRLVVSMIEGYLETPDEYMYPF